MVLTNKFEQEVEKFLLEWILEKLGREKLHTTETCGYSADQRNGMVQVVLIEEESKLDLAGYLLIKVINMQKSDIKRGKVLSDHLQE